LKAPRVPYSNTSRAMDTWMTPYVLYLANSILPTDVDRAKVIRRNARRYTMIDGHLFRNGYSHPLLTCVDMKQENRILSKLHEGICRSHIGGKALSLNVTRARYFWPTLKDDNHMYVKRCEQCQKHADWHHEPAEELHSIFSLCSFHTWGIDILGPFPQAIRQLKYLIVAIEYFTKWIEVEPVAVITVHKVQTFLWKNVVCRFRIPRKLISYNEK